MFDEEIENSADNTFASSNLMSDLDLAVWDAEECELAKYASLTGLLWHWLLSKLPALLAYSPPLYTVWSEWLQLVDSIA